MNSLAPDLPFNTADITTTPVESSTFNLERRGYEMALREWLQQAKHFHQFKNRVTEALLRMGFSDWTYSRLDIPLPLSIDNTVGTLGKDQLPSLMGGNRYVYDFVYQHIKVNKYPVFSASINAFVENLTLKSKASNQRNNRTEQKPKNYYHDCVFIPIYSDNLNNHAVFSIAAKAVDSKTLRQLVKTYADNISILIKLFEEVGVYHYAEQFLGAKNTYCKLLNTRSMRLLELMGREDFNISQAAEALHMSRTAADKQLAKIREYLGVNTTHGALVAAIQQGYISPRG